MNKGESKNDKKIKEFFKDKEKEKPIKKYKTFVTFLEGLTEDETAQLYIVHYETVFVMLESRFEELEEVGKKDKKHVEEVLQFCKLLKLAFVHLRELLKKRWHYHGFVVMLERLSNK